MPYYADFTLDTVTLDGNDAENGGAVYQEEGSLTFTDVAVTDNTAEYIENWDPKQRRHAFP